MVILKLKLILLFSLLISCSLNRTREQNSALGNEHDSLDSANANKTSTQASKAEVQEEKNLHLQGIYRYAYAHNTSDLNENHFIAFITRDDLVEGWYYGTSDEFDEAREAYLPGFFVSRIENLRTKGDSLFFEVTTGYNKCFKNPIAIGEVNHLEILESNEIWNDYTEDHVLRYRAKLSGLTMQVAFKEETRKYEKETNYFFMGINNFDPDKCRGEALLAIREKMDRLNESLILDFLSTFSVVCEPNVEFNQWSNELLFRVMEKQPDIFAKTLYKNLATVDTTAIFDVIGAPLLDPDLRGISEKISRVDVDQKLKNKIIRRLAVE
jgi:hypothetical protein